MISLAQRRKTKAYQGFRLSLFDSSITPLTANQPILIIFYYPSIFSVVTDSDSDRLRKFLYAKIAKRKKQIHPAHNSRFNYDMQLEIDCIEWALHKIEVNKLPNGRLEGVIKTMIKDLEKRKDKAMIRSDTDNLWTKIETLQ